MKALFHKYWPSFAHALVTAIVMGDSHVRNYAVVHPGWSGPILLLWGIALHWATSPRQSPGSKF